MISPPERNDGKVAIITGASQGIGAGLAKAYASAGRIDTLINNAGIYIGKPFTEYTLEDFNVLIAVNLVGFFHITTRTIQHMLDKGRGHVVNVSTTLVERPDSRMPAALSVLTKGGLVAVTKSLTVGLSSPSDTPSRFSEREVVTEAQRSVRRRSGIGPGHAGTMRGVRRDYGVHSKRRSL